LQQQSQLEGRLHLLERRGKLGLGTAYIASFRRSLRKAGDKKPRSAAYVLALFKIFDLMYLAANPTEKGCRHELPFPARTKTGARS
jgi:hypothetical protein